MSANFVFECDRCGFKVKQDVYAEHNPPKEWWEVDVRDANYSPARLQQKHFCRSCASTVNQAMFRIPDAKP